MTFLNIENNNKIDKEIANNAEYEFNISESGLYLIEIIASAKSWWQNLKELRTFFNDDDLAVKIDGVEFPKLTPLDSKHLTGLSGKKGLLDGEIQKNPDSKKFKNWYWAGSLDNTANAIDTKKEGWKEFKKELNLLKGLHYIELWADRMPSLENIKIILEDAGGEDEQDEKQQITAKVVWEITKFRSEPKLDEKNILGELKEGDEVEIMEKAIEGECPTNERKEFLTSDRWHKVKWQNKEGYIFSMVLEIAGEDKETIQDFIIQKAKELGEDESLMLAIAKQESKFFPYCVSDMEAEGLFQLKEEAMIDVNTEFQKDFNNRFDIRQSIEAGILYWKIIEKKYKSCDEFLSRCLAAWNRGLNRVSNTKPFILEEQPIETRQFIKNVNAFWQENKDNIKNQGKILLYLVLVAGIISFGAFLLFLFFFKFNKPAFKIPPCYSNFSAIDEKIIDMDQDGKKEKLMLINDVPNSTFNIIKMLLIKRDGSFIELHDEGSELQWWKTGDFNKNGKIDIAVLYGYTGSAGFGDFYLYEWDRDKFITLFSREEIGSKVSFKDVDKDGTEEMLYEFFPRKWSKKQLDIYKWDNEKLVYDKFL